MLNLRSLDITAVGGVSLHLEPTFLKTNTFEFLREITIKDCNAVIGHVIKYMFRENLETMHIEEMDIFSQVPDYSDSHSSRLINLSLGMFHPPPLILRKFLELAPTLKSLSCFVSGDGYSELDVPYEREIMGPHSPANIVRTLLPVQQSLTHLHLDDGTHTLWLYGDSSHMDLSLFRSLTTLRAPAKCFFKAQDPNESRNGVYSLLPPSLEGLDVSIKNTKSFVLLMCLLILYRSGSISAGICCINAMTRIGLYLKLRGRMRVWKSMHGLRR